MQSSRFWKAQGSSSEEEDEDHSSSEEESDSGEASDSSSDSSGDNKANKGLAKHFADLCNVKFGHGHRSF